MNGFDDSRQFTDKKSWEKANTSLCCLHSENNMLYLSLHSGACKVTDTFIIIIILNLRGWDDIANTIWFWNKPRTSVNSGYRSAVLSQLQLLADSVDSKGFIETYADSFDLFVLKTICF